jgi:hypothetical protein
MRISRTLGLLVAALFSVWTAVPVMGQSPVGGGPAAAQSKPADVKGDKDKDRDKDVKADKKDDKDEKAKKKAGKGEAGKKHAKKPKDVDDKDADDNGHGNKGGKLRGLDRADQVAGEHGKQGRDNARAKQGR